MQFHKLSFRPGTRLNSTLECVTHGTERRSGRDQVTRCARHGHESFRPPPSERRGGQRADAGFTRSAVLGETRPPAVPVPSRWADPGSTEVGGLARAGTPKALRNCCLPSWDSHRQRLGDFRLVQGAGAPDWALQAGDLGRVLLTAQAGGPGGEVRQSPVGLKGPPGHDIWHGTEPLACRLCPLPGFRHTPFS